MIDWLAARGEIAAGVAHELADPLDRVHATLAKVVERLDRHVSTSRGPEPLSWQVVSEVRERIAEMYLEIGRVRRLAENLALLGAPAARGRADVNDIVERALSLAHHRFAADGDALLDLGSPPPVLVDAARLTQAVALLIGYAADVAGPDPVTVTTSGSAAGASIVLSAPGASRPVPFVEAIRAAVTDEGGWLELDGSGFSATLTLPRYDALR
jgi:C4-dicarboxylate-specific signal transduction histidine kinase